MSRDNEHEGLLRFKRAKAPEIEALRVLEKKGALPLVFEGPRSSFLEALRDGYRKRSLGFVAEYKRASPSLGDIELGLSPQQAARAYQRADAISVLTEEVYFKGSLSYIKEMAVRPILRKDFIFDSLQVIATAGSPASALLLIVKLTPVAKKLRELRELAESFSLSAVVEVFDEEDLALARESGASIIQVNARNLETLKVDTRATIDFIEKNKPKEDEFWVAASGLTGSQDLIMAREAGFNAVLVGTALMKSGQPEKELALFLDILEGLR